MTKGFRAGRDAAAISENIEVLTGQRGDGRNRAVTYAELADLDLAKLRAGAGGKLQLKPSPNDNTGPAPAFPTQPRNFKANGGFGAVLLEWDMPNYRGHSLTEIYRSTEDNLANAVMVASSAAAVYGDPVDPGWQGYYWIRFINSAGVAGPYNASEGTPAKTAADIDEIIDLINQEINNSPLIGELASGIEDLDQNGGQAFQKMWSTKVSASGITAGIGIVAGRDADGNPISQVAISASQMFVFDPNNPTDTGTYAIPFSVVDGKVVITEAVIREATIKILNAQTIIADEVKAGISISTPTLNSATINNGKFTVDAAGNLKIGDLFSVSNTGRITIRQGTGSVGLVITNERIEVYDENGALMVRLGKLN
ncbi:phage tail tip fiber protein [Yersinia enterocolitica]